MSGEETDAVLTIDRFSQTPIYEQIISEIERLILLGLLEQGGALPSVRNLSQELSINPNTLQKAYSELERRGICKSVPGTGRFISENAVATLKNEYSGALDALEATVKRLALSGVPLETVCDTIKKAYCEAK